MADYIPSSDGDFDAWQANFITYASANAAALGLDPLVDIPPLTAAQTTWTADRAAHTAAQAAAESARQAKDAGRGGLEGVIRPLVARLQASPEVDDAERQASGITVRDTIPTPVGPPLTRPVASVDTRERLQHTISFADEATPTRRAKPAGVRGAQIWVKIGDPAPLDPSELTFLATDTRTPYLATFDGADAKKVAHYMLRWESTRGETGPWSETASATIGA
ncbi:MAG: hypothetical protein FVQ82_15575 [Planctomycetes bacterium]|nr:hypothetical protein [Planctomycetota bacterium]